MPPLRILILLFTGLLPTCGALAGIGSLPQTEVRANGLFADPAVSLTIYLAESGEVKAELLNEDGEFIRLLQERFYTVGEHNLQIPRSELEPGRYILRVVTPMGILAKPFLVEPTNQSARPTQPSL